MPRTISPVADVEVNGWVNEDDGTSLFDHLDPGGEFVHSRRRFRDGPQRILMITTDDGARWPIDYGGTITSGNFRNGQNARQQTINRIIARGTNFVNMRTDHSPCSPGRAAF